MQKMQSKTTYWTPTWLEWNRNVEKPIMIIKKPTHHFAPP
jgi:hypothetical protein